MTTHLYLMTTEIREFAKELRGWADCDARAGEPLGSRMRLAADKLEELAAENERLKEDRARFPSKPDDIGRMIEAHIGNLKVGKKSAEDAADRALNRAFRAETALTEKDNEIATLREALRGMSCPHPCNHRPSDWEVGLCFDAGECRCIAGVALAYNAGGNTGGGDVG